MFYANPIELDDNVNVDNDNDNDNDQEVQNSNDISERVLFDIN